MNITDISFNTNNTNQLSMLYIRVLYDNINSKKFDVICNSDNINFDGTYFRYGVTERRFYFEVFIDCISSDLTSSKETLIFEKIYDFNGEEEKFDAFKKLIYDIHNICIGKNLFFCKITNQLYLSNEDVENDTKRSVKYAKRKILNIIQECCICYEDTVTQLECCSGKLCYLCLKKIFRKGICPCCEDVYKYWKCPLCRTEHRKHIDNMFL